MIWLRNAIWWLLLLPVRLPSGFDAQWYASRYSDVSQSGVWPSVHYRRHGRREQRDPGPGLSASSQWLRSHHNVQLNAADGWLPMLCGTKPPHSNRRTIVFVGHLAGHRLFGGERSLLDLVSATEPLAFNVYVLLPEAFNREYVEALAQRCCGVKIIPFAWWRSGKEPSESSIQLLSAFFKQISASAVYINTITPDEPLLAANLLGLPVAMHLRETLVHDKTLSEVLNADQDLLECRLKERVGLVVANSRFTAEATNMPEALIVPNGIDLKPYASLSPAGIRREPFTVGMISSNLPKKGLYDFMDLAKRLERDDVSFLLVGPETAEIVALKKKSAKSELPQNVIFAGYFGTPLEVLDRVDVLLNLSRFHETFGRTVLEAMAAGRVVVAYRQGAIPELISHEESGILVETGDIVGVANAIRQVRSDCDFRQRLAENARLAAIQYDKENFQSKVRQALEMLVFRTVGARKSSESQ